MATEAQIAASQANAKLSCGPKTSEGKAASSKNHVIHGLSYLGGMFILLPWKSAGEFDYLVVDLKSEYRPKNRTEMILVERMAQHHWLRNRATLLRAAKDKSRKEKSRDWMDRAFSASRRLKQGVQIAETQTGGA